MLVHKKGKVVDIPIRRGAVVKLRENRTGKTTNTKAIVVGLAPHNNYTRAYGREAFVCVLSPKSTGVQAGGRPYVVRKNESEVFPVGRAKRIPKMCRAALEEYERTYPDLGRKKRRR